MGSRQATNRFVAKVVAWFYGKTIVVTEPTCRVYAKLDIGNGNRGNGCRLSWQSHPLQMKVPCLLILVWSCGLGGERSTRPFGALGRRWAVPVQWSTYCSSRGLMYCKSVNVCSAGCSLVFLHCREDILRWIEIFRSSVSVWDWKFNSPDPLSFLSLKVKADTASAPGAETEEAADFKQCLQKETQRQEESEARLQMLGLSGSEVL